MKTEKHFREGGLFSYLQLKPPEEASYAQREGPHVLWQKANNYELKLHFPVHNEQKVKKMLHEYGRELYHLHEDHPMPHMTIVRMPYTLQFISLLPAKKK